MTTWAEDCDTRMNPELMTELLHDATPVLKHVGWKLLEVRTGYARSVLPLNYECTNHHGTHQAALIMLAGDCTGGTALGTPFPGARLMGVHPITTEDIHGSLPNYGASEI